MRSINNLDTMPEGYALVHLAEIDSTNSEAMRHMAQGRPLWVLADRQTAGRGRRGRAWQSPKGNLMASLLLPESRPIAEAGQFSFVAALALYDVVAHYAEAKVQLKWPNDVLLNGAKLGGILLESCGTKGGMVEGLVVGCGLNIASAPEDTPYPATCLGQNLSPKQALLGLAHCFVAWQNALAENGFTALLDEWRKRAIGMGEEINVRLEAETLVGRFVDLTEEGALILQQENTQRVIAAGDVFFPPN